MSTFDIISTAATTALVIVAIYLQMKVQELEKLNEQLEAEVVYFKALSNGIPRKSL